MKYSFLIGMGLLAAIPGFSGEGNRPKPFQVEITPSVGFIGSSPVIGLEALLNYSVIGLSLSGDQAPARHSTFYQLLVNLNINLGQKHKVRPYAILGSGMMLAIPKQCVDCQSVTTLGFSFGGGFKYLWSRRVGFQLEGKQLFTEVENRADIKELYVFFHNKIGIIFRL